MTTLRTYKFLIIPVLQQVDQDGNVTGEAQPEQPDIVFGIDGLQQYAEGFAYALELQNVALRNGNQSAAVIDG